MFAISNPSIYFWDGDIFPNTTKAVALEGQWNTSAWECGGSLENIDNIDIDINLIDKGDSVSLSSKCCQT